MANRTTSHDSFKPDLDSALLTLTMNRPDGRNTKRISLLDETGGMPCALPKGQSAMIPTGTEEMCSELDTERAMVQVSLRAAYGRCHWHDTIRSIVIPRLPKGLSMSGAETDSGCNLTATIPQTCDDVREGLWALLDRRAPEYC